MNGRSHQYNCLQAIDSIFCQVFRYEKKASDRLLHHCHYRNDPNRIQDKNIFFPLGEYDQSEIISEELARYGLVLPTSH
jgi:hypothetical protein